MVDTMRTLADLDLLLADNKVGDISAQDLRDALLATIAPGHAEICILTPAATVLADTTTWVELAGTYLETVPIHHWTMATNAQLKYTSPEDRICHIAASCSFTTASNNQIIEFAIALDGVPIVASVVKRKTSTGSDIGALALHGYIPISQASHLSIMVRNTSSASNMTAETLNLFVMDMAF